MPPRRSLRSTRASIEPAPTETLPSKRKRRSAVESTTEKKESVAKPPSRATSSRQVPAPVARTRTLRPRTSLPKIGEEEEEEAEAPTKKKARLSVDTGDEDESDAEPVKPTLTRKSTRSSKIIEIDEDALSQPPKRPPSKRGKGISQKVTTPNTTEEELEKRDVKPQTRGRRSKNTTDGDVERVDVPLNNSQKGRQGRSPKARVSFETPSKELEDDEDVNVGIYRIQESLRPPPSSQPKPSQPLSEEEGAESHLVDSITTPPPETLAQSTHEQLSGPQTRLVIHKIVLINFKSYAGRQIIGPFHKSFSAIVGPNGSGKSNTIDALLFVFGFRAVKMRQTRISELIHNSARYPDLDECSVEVHFRDIIDLPGPDAFKIVPNSDLVVARHAYRNNQSTYTINGQNTSYTEVQTLLKGRGIDLDHKRFLILQGEVESIAQMKAKGSTEHEDGLLEYLEDIIGTSDYKQKIDEAFKELELHAEQRVQKLNKLRFVEREKAALEDEKREAENFLRLKNELVRAQSRYWQWILWKCFQAEADYQAQEVKLRKELAAETEKNKDDIAHLQLLRKHFQEREEAYQEVREAAEAASKELTGKEKQEVQLQEKLKHANGKTKKLMKQLTEDKNSKKRAEREIEESTDKVKKGKGRLEEQEISLEKEEKVLEGIQEGLKDKTQAFHDQIEVKQKELQPWMAKVNEKQTTIDIAQGERDALVQKAVVIEKAEKEAEEILANKRTDQQAKIAQQENLRQQKKNLQQDLEDAQKSNQNAQIRLQEWRMKSSSAHHKVEEARASQSENRSQGKVLDSLQRLKSRGQIQGFHGRLGSLGTIDEKYDIAISTACGQLNNLVVDTVEQAQQCIEYLRSQNIGRATFMVLEKMSQDSRMNKISTPENVPRLFDLIKFKDSRFAPAFYKALHNTLVATDLDQANRIAYGATRWRVVTLAGQTFETSGTMSGGGNQPQRGGMSSRFAAEAVRPEVVQQYERDSAEALKNLEQAMQEAKQAEVELERLKRSGPELDMSYQKLGLEIETGKRSISEAEKRVRDLKTQNKPNQGDIHRISTLDTAIESTTAELEQLQAKSAKIEDAIKGLEKRILEIGGSKLLSQKSKIDGIRLMINLANDEITKAEVTKVKAEKDIIKLASSIEVNEGTYEEYEGEVRGLQETLQELQTYLRELKAKCNDAQQAADNSKEDLDELKKELDGKEEQIQEFLKKQQALERGIQDNAKELKTNGDLITHWQSQHDQLVLEEVDSDDEGDDDDDGTEEPSKDDDDAQGEGEEGQGGQRVKSDPDVSSRKSAQQLHEYTPEELAPLRKRELIADVELLDEKVKKATPDLSVLKEYKRREAEFDNRVKELAAVTELRDKKKAEYDGYRKDRLDKFMSGFTQISARLKEMYQMITLGGNAELELVDSLDPFAEGIIFSVMPPKKSWKNISNLSGGEKTLSSLALVFALHHFKPTPLYFMDEIDAALDFRNVSIVANYIKDRTKNAQFIIISLRNDMFELSRRLIGIYKTNNTTKSLCIANRDKLQKEKERQKTQRQLHLQQSLQTPQGLQRSPQKQTLMQVGASTASQM